MKLNFRQAERKATEYATEAQDMDDDEVTNLAAIYWNVPALNSALASCLITTTTGEVGTLVRRVLQAFPGSGLRAWQELNKWHRPKSVVEGAASMAGIIAPSRAKSMSFSTSSWTWNSVWHNTKRDTTNASKFRQGRSTEENDDSRDGRTLHRRPNHVP